MKQQKFWIGCNYWPSNAGCHSWRKWDESAVRMDMKRMAEAGMNCLRVFPNWADFQPATPILEQNIITRYAMADGSRPTNPWYIDEEMLRRFEIFCDIAEENSLSLIVGPITGWMSGRLFVPPALYGVNLFHDPKALMLEQKFIQGFVSSLRRKKAIVAWDHGNECDAMFPIESREEMQSWTMMITNAIRAADPTRPVVTGIHNLNTDGTRQITDQGECVDMLVTHPYPFWVKYAGRHPVLGMKSLVHAAAQTAFYADISGKPCLVEEIGTMGPMVCSEETSAKFLRLNMLHAYAYGRPGMLWWNGFDQPFDESPYLENSCERELGMFTIDGQPKEFTREMTRMVERLQELPEVSGYHVDAVCILTKNTDGWKLAFATWLLATQAGLTVAFADGNQPIPEANAYILPNVTGPTNLDRDRWEVLKARVRSGAKLYLSLGTGILAEFEEVTGLHIEDSAGAFTCEFEMEGVEISGQGQRKLIYRDEPNGLHCHRYGLGQVYTLDFSPEDTLFDLAEPEQSNFHRIYRHIFLDELLEHPIDAQDPEVGVLWHDQDSLCSIFNYSGEEKEIAGFQIPPYDGVTVPVS